MKYRIRKYRISDVVVWIVIAFLALSAFVYLIWGTFVAHELIIPRNERVGPALVYHGSRIWLGQLFYLVWGLVFGVLFVLKLFSHRLSRFWVRLLKVTVTVCAVLAFSSLVLVLTV